MYEWIAIALGCGFFFCLGATYIESIETGQSIIELMFPSDESDIWKKGK